MIVRLMGEGQREIKEEADVALLNKLDTLLEETIEAGNKEEFSGVLLTLIQQARRMGEPVPDESLLESDAILPPSDATLDEVRQLLGEEGLIPG